MNHLYTFKEVSLDDLASILPQAEHAFLPSVDNPEETTSELLKEQKSKKGFHCFALYHKKEICSFIITWPYKEEDTVAIGPMFVSAKYRGQGLGTLQVIKLSIWAKEHNIKGIFTKTWEHNLASRATFTKTGFSIIGEKAGDRITGESTIKYFLTL